MFLHTYLSADDLESLGKLCATIGNFVRLIMQAGVQTTDENNLLHFFAMDWYFYDILSECACLYWVGDCPMSLWKVLAKYP